ncbi:acetyl-coenzyme A synthetase N-terminal domain-containing protein, partial [Halovulum sp. GXIMD14794]
MDVTSGLHDSSTVLEREESARSGGISAATYEQMYASSVSDPSGFWGEQGKRLDWIEPYSVVKNTS